MANGVTGIAVRRNEMKKTVQGAKPLKISRR